MYNHYQHKVKTLDELRAIIGARPRSRRVVMCHGTFDIVHPGHIRHLHYAKQRGDVLVASITSDEHVSKGEGRPYVPLELRVANLAALEMVDYVLIDENSEPLANIASLEPEFFVKGFEYSAGGVHPKSQQEMDAVSAYGGEFVFSPGDVVFSSTQLLEQHRPRLTLDKVATLLEAEGVTFDALRRTLEQMAGVTVHVVGDTIVDKYSYCTLLGTSTKTPTFSVSLDRSERFVGGAGIVAKHLRSLGALVAFTTVLGDDTSATFVAGDISSVDVQLNAAYDDHRPTTFKERFWAGGYKLLQVDTVDNSPLSARHVEQVADQIGQTKADLVVFSDFRHGLFHSDSIGHLVDSIPKGAVKVADSQVSSRWGNILDFKGFDLVTPNEHEARFALGDQDSGVRHLAQRLITESQAKHLILKMGERGILAYRRPSATPRSFFYVDSFAENIVDTVGAGDALLATASLALVCSGDIVKSAILGNLAAAVACEHEGNVSVRREQILDKLGSLERMAQGLPV